MDKWRKREWRGGNCAKAPQQERASCHLRREHSEWSEKDIGDVTDKRVIKGLWIMSGLFRLIG